MVAKRNPYAMLTVIVSIATVVIICVTTLSVAIIGGMFIMYGEMKGIRADSAAISKMLDKRETEDKVTRTYTASVLARQDFMVGLMTAKQQTQVNSYDRSNPIRRPSDKSDNKEN